MSESDAKPSEARQLVETFLAAVAAKDIATAKSCLAETYVLTATGGQEFNNMAGFIALNRSRNAGARKTIQGWDELVQGEGPDAVTVLYNRGVMAGSWLDGSSFEGIRYCDRFCVRGGRIISLEVYSDMAEFRPPEAAGGDRP